MTKILPRRKLPSDKPIVLVDVDGTVADAAHRLKYVTGPRKNWKRFFEAMDKDPPIEAVVEWVQSIPPDKEVVIVTGRPEEYARETLHWLRQHKVPFCQIYMRPDGDHRPDYVVKRQVLDEIPPNRIAFVIDDRPQVCKMWRGAGLKVYEIPTDDRNKVINEVYRRPEAEEKHRELAAK